jgi:hypothetical protein
MSINLRVLYLFVLSEENTKGNNANNSNDAEHKPKLNVRQNCFYGIEKPLDIVRVFNVSSYKVSQEHYD